MDLSNRKEILPAELAWALFGLFDDYSLHSVGSMESHSWRMFRHALKNNDNPLFSQTIVTQVQQYMNSAFERYTQLEEAYPTGQYLPPSQHDNKYIYFGGGSKTHAIVMYMLSPSQYLIFNSGEGSEFHFNHEPIAYLNRGTKFVTRYFHDDPLFMLMHYGGIISNTGLSYRMCGIYPRYIFHPATEILYIPLTEVIWLDATSAISLTLGSGNSHLVLDTVKKEITFVETGEEGFIHWYNPAEDTRDITTRFSLPLSFMEIVKQKGHVSVYEWYEGKGHQSTQYRSTIQKMFQFGAVSVIFDYVIAHLIHAIASDMQTSFSQVIDTHLQPETYHALNHFRRIPYANLVAFLESKYGSNITHMQFALNHLQENYELYVALPEVLDMYQQMRVAKPELKSIAYAGFIVRTAHPVYVHHVTRRNTSHPFSDTPTFLRKHANNVDPGQPQKSSSCTYYAMYHCLRYLACGEHAQTKDTWNEFVFESLTRLQYRIFKAFMRWELFRYIPGGLNVPVLLIQDSISSKQLFNGHFALSAFEMVLYERQKNELDRLAKEELIQPNLALWFTRIRDWDRQIKSSQNFFKLYTNAISLAEDEHEFTTAGKMIQHMYKLKAGIDEDEEEEEEDNDDSYFHLLSAWFSNPNYLHDKLTDIKSLIMELETIYFITDHKGASAFTPHRSARRVMVNHLLKYALLHCADIFHAASLENMVDLFVEIHNIQAQRLHGIANRFDIFPEEDQSAYTIHIEDVNAFFLLALFHILLSKMITDNANPLVGLDETLFEPLQPPILFNLAGSELEELNTIAREHIRQEWLYFSIGRDEDVNQTPRLLLPAAYRAQWPEVRDIYEGSHQNMSLRIYPWQWMVAIMQYALLQRGDVDVHPPVQVASGPQRIELGTTALELPVHHPSTTIQATSTSNSQWTEYAISPMYDPLNPPINMASFCIYARNLFFERYLNIYQANIDEVVSILDIEISRSQGREIDIDNDINLKHVGAWEPPCIAVRGDVAGLPSLSIYKNTIDTLPAHAYASYYSNIYLPIIRKYKQLAQPTQLIHHWWSGNLHYDGSHTDGDDDATKILRGYYFADDEKDGARYYYTGSVEAITENPFLNLVFLRKDIDIQSMIKFFLWRHMIDPETELPDENPAKAECLATENRLKNHILLQESQTRLDTGVFYHHTFTWVMHELEHNMHLVEERQVKTLLQCVHDTMVVYAEFDALSQFYSKLDTSKSQQHTQLIPEQGSNLPILHIVKENRYNTLQAHIDDQNYYAMIKKYDEDEDDEDGDHRTGFHIFNMNPQYRTGRQPLFDINDHVLTIATSLRDYTAYFLDTRCLENPNYVLTVRAEITDLENDQAHYYIGKYRILLDTPKTMHTVIGLPHTFCLSSTSDDDVDAILVILPKQFASPASYGQFSFFPVGAPPPPAPAAGGGDIHANTSAYIVIPIRHPHKESILIFENYAEIYAYMVAVNLAGRYDLLIRIWPQWQFFSRSLQRANLPYLPLNSFQHDMYRNAYRYFAYGDEEPSSSWKGYLDWTTFPLHSIPRDIIHFDSIIDTTCHEKTAERQIEYLIKMFENYFFMKPMREDQVASVKHIFISARNATFQQMLMGGGKTSVLFPFLALAYMMRFRRKDTRVLFVTHSDALVQQSITAFHRVLAWTGVISINDDQLLTHARLGTILVQSDVNVKSIYLRSGRGFAIQAYHPISLLLVDEYDSCINPFTSAYIIGQDHASLRHKMTVTEAVASMMQFVQMPDMKTLQDALRELVRTKYILPIPWAVATLQVKFGMTYRIDYGVDPDRLIASPYVAFDQIAKGASFRDPTIQFLTTILTIREHGSTVKQNRALLKTYIDFHKEKEHLPMEWQKVANPEEYINIPFKDFESIAKFVERVLFSHVQSPMSVQECSFVELLVQDITRRGLILDPKVILGMTGTLTKHPGQIPAHAFQSREYQVFLDDKANKIIHTVLSTAEYLKLEDAKCVFALLSTLESGKNGALIDAAAMFIHQSIPELVEWIARQDQIATRYKIIFYISDNSEIMQYMIEKRMHERFKGMISQFNGHILYFYDQSHCIGFDIPQAQPDPIPIHGYVTLKSRLRKSFVSQAAFRLRTLYDANIQTVAFVSVDEEVDQEVLQENEQLFLDTCTEKLGEQTLRALARVSANQQYEVIPWFQNPRSTLEYAEAFTTLDDIRVIVEREYEAEAELELEIELEKEQEQELTLERSNVLQPDMIGSFLRFKYEYELYRAENWNIMFRIPMLGTMTTLPFKHTWITLSSNEDTHEWTIAWTPVDMDEYSKYEFVTQCCFNFDTFAFEDTTGTTIPETVFQWYLVMVIFLSIIQCRTVTLTDRMKLSAFAKNYPIEFFKLVSELRKPFYNTEYHKFIHTLIPPHIDLLLAADQPTPAAKKGYLFASQVFVRQLQSIPKHQYELFRVTVKALAERMPVVTRQTPPPTPTQT